MKTLLLTSLLILTSTCFATIRNADIGLGDQDDIEIFSNINSNEARVDLLYPSPQKNMCGIMIRGGRHYIKAEEILKRLVLLVDDFSENRQWKKVGTIVNNKIIAPKPDLESFPYIQVYRLISRDPTKTIQETLAEVPGTQRSPVIIEVLKCNDIAKEY